MLPLGFLSGVWLLPLTVLFAGLSALAFALPAALMHGHDLRGLRIPFGPFLCLGALLNLLWGRQIFFWWLGLVG
jgi:leader peptidase (prepilin peptidase)/N-methyltransferase